MNPKLPKPKAQKMWAVIDGDGTLSAARLGYRQQAILAELNALPSDTPKETVERYWKKHLKYGKRVAHVTVTWSE